ncbi:MAG: hypothetical protein NTU43_04900, partial [Bacteroidetes bacterium]|nr:hypothetical protein [Bacteroidota bacterium]
PAMLTLSSVNNTQGATVFSFDTSYVLPGDTLYCSITVSTNAQQLPYYPKQLAFYGKTHNLAGISGSFKITGVVYFTLYNTLEIWSINDFHRQPRVWTMEKSPEPERTYISKENIPVSILFPDSLITEDWQRNYWLKSVAGLPYKIKMRPLHPDTITAMKLKDSIESGTRGLGKGGWTWYERNMYGSVTGTIRAGYTNDVNQPQTLNLKGITVRAYDEDNLWNDFLGSAITDENGNFTINYDTYQWEEHIELFVRIITSNSGTGVYQDDINPCLLNDEYVLSTSNVNVTEGYHVTNIGVWNLPTPAREPFKILNWATRAQEFVNTQVGSVPRDYLSVFCYGAGSDFINFPCQRLRLEDVDVSHETVIWHEMGHYLMENLSGFHISSPGDHSSQAESIFTRAWSEGWATGFMSMVDQFYRGIDDEYGNYAFLEQVGFINNRYPTELRNRYRLVGGAPKNGMKSEYHIGTFLYDLYDGPTKFAGTEPTSSYEDLPDSPSPLNYTDRTGFDANYKDDLELSTAQIFSPLIFAKQYSFGIYSINEYYMLLVRLLNDCGQPKKIQKLLTQNGILDYTPNQQTNTDVLSTDLIGYKHTMTGYYGPFGALSVIDNYYTDLSALYGTTQSFNMGLV